MGKIVLLDELTINQIAAGEVIERPASVIKELVENSIDAGAKNITVDIKNGGISYIRVIDDGSGIMPDDMEIAFERHATSKIRKTDDLNEVKSMGFRGEALASIAAIAKVDLVSKTAESDIGYKISAEGGEIIDMHEEGAAKGTSITVKELFFNTPVRYKFLKKDFTESGYIEDTIVRIALANPDISIKLINSGKTVVQTNGNGKIEDCIYTIYGKEIYENVLPVNYDYEDYHISGVIGKPIISRSNRSNQLFFVNKRYIKDKTLTSAAENGFKGLVTIGKHGFLILNIDMDPKKVDVNVHPTKLEVRFQEEQKVFKAVMNAIKETLLKSNLVSDPVKDYESITPNDMLKEIKNKDRVEAWNINKETKKSEIKAAEPPKFDEFRNKIAQLDAETRKSFLNEITNSKSPEEITEKLSKLNKILQGPSYIPNKERDTEIKNIKETQIEEKNDIKDEKEEKNSQEIEDKKQEDINKEEFDQFEEQDESEIDVKGMVTKDEDIGETYQKTNLSELLIDEEEPQIEDTKKEENKVQEVNEDDEPLDTSFEEMYKRLFGRDIETAKKEYDESKREEEEKEKENEIESTPIKDNEVSIFDKEGEASSQKYQFIGIAFKTYIILSKDSELFILDQHAAHERIMYEKIKENYYNDKEKDSQLMLLPDVINLNNKEMGIFRDNKEMFNKAGFIVDEFGENTVKLTGVPEFCIDFDTKDIFLETLDEIDTVARTAKQEIEDKFLSTIACKAAVKANMALSKDEVDSLMEQLLKLPNPFSCPHGRPTVIKMTKTDIEKKFSRR